MVIFNRHSFLNKYSKLVGLIVVVVGLVIESLAMPNTAVANNDNYRWWTMFTGIDTVHRQSSRNFGSGATVGVIDGRADCSHIELAFSNCHSVGLPGTYFFRYGDHATHVLTTIGANIDHRLGSSPGENFIGAAPKAALRAYGMVGSVTGWHSRAEDAAVSDAYHHGARVMNLSYGPVTQRTGGYYPNGTLFLPWQFERMYRLMPAYKNMVFVKAAGNDGSYLQNAGYISTLPGTTGDPSVDFNNLIIVGAAHHGKDLAPFTNAPGERCFYVPGDAVCQEKNKYKYFFLVAPGVDVRAGVPSPSGTCRRRRGNGPWESFRCSWGYKTFQGTSMAAPIVTGAVALLHGRWPILKNRGAATANILFTTAEDRGAPGVDGLYGWGFLRVDRAFSPLGTRYFSDGGKRYPWTSGGGGGGSKCPGTGGGAPPKKNPPKKHPHPAEGGGDRMLLSNVLNQVSLRGQYVSFFDAYDRDFPLLLGTYRTPLSSVLRRELAWSGLSPPDRATLTKTDHGVWSFQSTIPYTSQPYLQDIHWQFRHFGKISVTSAGYGDSMGWFNQPKALSLSFLDDDVTTSGVNPVLQLATNGLHVSNQLNINKNFSVTAGFTANSEKLGLDEIRSAAQALMLSASVSSNDQRWQTNLTATRLSERDGLLGSRLTGAFGQDGQTGTVAVTLANDWALGKDYVLSGSFTLARSDTGDGFDRMLDFGKYITSDAMAVGIMKTSLFHESDKVQVSISQPLRISSGTAKLSHDDYYDEHEQLHRRTVDINLEPAGREVAFQLGYTRNLTKFGTVKALLYHAADYGHVAGDTVTGALIRFERTF